MILPGDPYQIYLAMRPVDFRKGHAGLALIVQEVLGRDPFSGAILFGAALEPSPVVLELMAQSTGNRATPHSVPSAAIR